MQWTDAKVIRQKLGRLASSIRIGSQPEEPCEFFLFTKLLETYNHPQEKQQE